MNLKIIGAGELGSRLGSYWRKLHPKVPIFAETFTAVRHGTLSQLGMTPCLRSLRDTEEKYDSLVFSVPPSSQSNYLAEVMAALEHWNQQGPFVFVSSTAVYQEDNGGIVNEYSAEAQTSRAQRLLDAEKQILARGGTVIRMAGLYSLNRGPHRAYERQPQSALSESGWLNLIHYEDASRLCAEALLQRTGNTCFLGCDSQPLTRKSFVDCANQYLPVKIKTVFESNKKVDGKRCDNKITRQALSWEPEVPSFEWFCKNYSTQYRLKA